MIDRVFTSLGNAELLTVPNCNCCRRLTHGKFIQNVTKKKKNAPRANQARSEKHNADGIYSNKRREVGYQRQQAEQACREIL